MLIRSRDWERDATIPYRQAAFSFNASIISDLRVLLSGDWQSLAMHDEERNYEIKLILDVLKDDGSA